MSEKPLPALELRLPKKVFEKRRAPQGMRNFTVWRQYDETGISGEDMVCQGTLYADGQAAIQWICPPAAGDIVVKPWESWLDVHVRQHPKNRTIITWEDGETNVYDPKQVKEPTAE